LKDFARYSKEHPHLLVAELPPLLGVVARAGVVADLGCGGGAILWALEQQSLLGEIVYGVDRSSERLHQVRAAVPRISTICSDATHVEALPGASVDGVIASQLIEHLPDDRALAPEIARLLRRGGWWYIGSVLRGRWAWWVYRVDGQRRLDPTHVREYRTPEAFRTAIEHPQLRITSFEVSPLRYPATDMLLRGLASIGALSHGEVAGVYARHRVATWLRRARFRVPGYRLIEAAGTKIE
jgi:SAM-dependent methyltransferase